jgi:hypothetical protein
MSPMKADSGMSKHNTEARVDTSLMPHFAPSCHSSLIAAYEDMSLQKMSEFLRSGVRARCGAQYHHVARVCVLAPSNNQQQSGSGT